ncbi:ABC transporter ATP-binding protein [Sphingobacterium oryzagri]|uniref:ABC transporter ATP-binding protein n=1 Tax=Sphingobacterium oryzagri TaxID=3025669 RepID=A0ABY7WF83_9SPHI|nr:ABC transporter ATP-binding protein [Sphingobacterium sp. KACC 22765]WDF67269.1 ABC transporter ATP-binding protein [Sphingobacterium sp. KACC 22765]
MASTILNLTNVCKSYGAGNRTVDVLRDISFDIAAGTSASIVGPSGSGKTTLLGLCAGLDQSTAGEIWLNGIKLNGLSEDKLAAVRNEHIGFVFQNFQLLPTLTALENVLVPLELKGMRNRKATALDLLAKVGLKDRASHYPSQLSGGEQQRVSLARAFANQPKILFADEPTGNLDAETGMLVENLLFDLNNSQGTTLVLVTHDLDLAAKTDRILPIKGGRLA